MKRIDMSGFANVIVVLAALGLLMSLLVSRPYHTGTTGLPRVEHPKPMGGAARADALLITIVRDGMIYLGRDRATPAQLPSKIRDGIQSGAERKVYIRADGRVRYGRIQEVLDGVRYAGVENVGFLVEQRKMLSVGP